MFGSGESQLGMGDTHSSQRISCLAVEKQMLLVLWTPEEHVLERFYCTGFKFELHLVCGEVKYTSLFKVVFKEMYSFTQIFIPRFPLAEKCLKYFLNWGNRSLPLESVSSAPYQIQREVQKAVSLGNETESLDASSGKINNKISLDASSEQYQLLFQI